MGAPGSGVPVSARRCVTLALTEEASVGHRTVVVITAVALLAGPLAGCAGDDAASSRPTASSTPTYLCSPAGATPSPCTPEQYALLEAQAQLAEQAKEVYRRLFNETTALQRQGGSKTPSAELSNVAGGPYLAGQQATLTKLAETGSKVTGEVKLKTLARVPGASEHGYEAALRVCVDATKAQVVQGTKTVSKGQLVAEVVYFKREDAALKAWDAEKADPATC